jgi:hypothetical protein
LCFSPVNHHFIIAPYNVYHRPQARAMALTRQHIATSFGFSLGLYLCAWLLTERKWDLGNRHEKEITGTRYTALHSVFVSFPTAAAKPESLEDTWFLLVCDCDLITEEVTSHKSEMRKCRWNYVLWNSA